MVSCYLKIMRPLHSNMYTGQLSILLLMLYVARELHNPKLDKLFKLIFQWTLDNMVHCVKLNPIKLVSLLSVYLGNMVISVLGISIYFFFNLQKQAMEAEQETEKAYKQIEKLKKKHEKEISTLNQFLAESRLPKKALTPTYDDSEMAKYDAGESHTACDQQWREEFEPFYNGEDSELSKLAEPSSWFSGYDRCNI